MKIVEFKNLSFDYATNKILENINLDIYEGEILVLIGSSGSGKTTLLNLMKKEISPVGIKKGDININTDDIAIVFQNTDSQILTSSVINDLVFGMENLGLDNLTMKKRLAEVVSFFGIEHLLHKNPENLSGGEKQLVVLSAALLTYPKLLLLDEPISQLDPIMALEFINILKRINEELGITIVLTEHRLNDVINIADIIGILSGGNISNIDEPKKFLSNIYKNDALKSFIPDVPKTSLYLKDEVVLNSKDLKKLIGHIEYKNSYKNISCETIVEIKNLIFSYEDTIVLKRLSAKFKKSKITTIFGSNGSGKSTLLKILAGIYKNYLGSIKIDNKNIAYIPQNTSTYFIYDTVYKEIYFQGCDMNYYNYLIDSLDIRELENRHPFDISGGEAMLVAFASVMLKKPDILFMDEPTKGLDNKYKDILAKIIKESETTIIMATHDINWSAAYADDLMMLFDGDIIYSGNRYEFFADNRYYTTALNKAFNNTDILIFQDILDYEKN